MVKIIHVESFDFYGTGSQQQQQDDKQVLKQHVKKLLIGLQERKWLERLKRLERKLE